MNNIVETYLMFKANNVCDYITILAEELRKVSKIPRQLNKLIYKYYDLFILSDKKIDYDLLKTKTELNEINEKMVLFYLLIEFDMASKTEYRDKELFEFYNFIVNSIVLFTELENNRVIGKKINYSDSIEKIIKDRIYMFDEDYIILLDKMFEKLNKKYNTSLKKEIKFNELYNNIIYSVNYTKIKRSQEFYLERLKYSNDKFLAESKKDVQLIGSEYDLKLNLVNIEMVSMRILKDTLSDINRKIFVRLDDEVISKKANFEDFVNMIKLRFLREKIIFLVNTSLIDKYEERINGLILDNFNISYYRNCSLTPSDLYKYGGYLMVDYDDMEEGISFSKENNLEIIVNKVNKEYVDKLNNIKYTT